MKFSAVLFLLLLAVTVRAQLRITELGEHRKVEDLVNAFFTGSGIKVQKIKYTGHNEAIGSFEDAGGFTGFSKGLVMANGRVELIAGANAKPNTSTNFGDVFFRDKHVLSKSSLCDGAVLEIDFIPQKDSIALSFIFGSEEYPEFTGKEFNDVFRIWLMPLFKKATAFNMARLPAKNAVSVNTVNDHNNPEYYIDNTDPANPFYQSIEFDGFTRAIKTGGRVEAGKLYRLKIIVVDLEDCEYDSGILLDAYSFRSLSSKPEKFKPVTRTYELNAAKETAMNQRIRKIMDSLALFTYDSLLIQVQGPDSMITRVKNQLWSAGKRVKCSKFVFQPAENAGSGQHIRLVLTAYRKPQ